MRRLHWEEPLRNKLLLTAILPLCVAAVLASTSVSAHHGNASFDYNKKVTLSGVVTDFLWANPHSILSFDAKDDKGEVTHWVVEAGGPPDMARQGWTHSSFKPGDQVTVTVIQAKNGAPIGRFVGNDNIILNGKPFPPSSGNSSAGAASAPKP
jgi:hypothetical protein